MFQLSGCYCTSVSLSFSLGASGVYDRNARRQGKAKSRPHCSEFDATGTGNKPARRQFSSSQAEIQMPRMTAANMSKHLLQHRQQLSGLSGTSHASDISLSTSSSPASSVSPGESWKSFILASSPWMGDVVCKALSGVLGSPPESFLQPVSLSSVFTMAGISWSQSWLAANFTMRSTSFLLADCEAPGSWNVFTASRASLRCSASNTLAKCASEPSTWPTTIKPFVNARAAACASHCRPGRQSR
mmetsp:Transcript_56607/g.132276  ORF Transcript_56607/g.132276 Transcript_56607/m.132276 type:complete len:244 (-) Transcript_56607:913-1644(-)